jgi:hypothetical protein
MNASFIGAQLKIIILLSWKRAGEPHRYKYEPKIIATRICFYSSAVYLDL